MRIFVGIVAVTSLLATSAFAADLPAKTKAPVEPIYDWTGLYVGGNVGYSWGRSSDTSTLTDPTGAVLLTTTGKSNLNGVVGGGQIGYSWQMQTWVYGIEADIQGTDEKGSRAFTFTPALTTSVPFSLTQKIDWFGTVRGRAGFLATSKVLLYATGGLAHGELNSSETVGGPLPATLSKSTANVGWTAGVGIEGAIGGSWTARLEYLYVDLGTLSSSFILPSVIVSSYSSHVTDNVLRVGVNYRFDSPVVAKY